MVAAFTSWVKENYEKNASIVNQGVSNLNGWIDRAKKIADIEDAARKTVEWANGLSDAFHAWGKNPLGSTLPSLDIASSPMMQYLKLAEDSYGKIVTAKEYKENDARAQRLSRNLRAETVHALTKEAVMATRNMLTAQKLSHSKISNIKASGMSHAEKFTREAGPINAEQLQNLTEIAYAIQSMLLDYHRRDFGEGQVRSRFNPKSAAKAKEDYKAGKGAVPQDE